MGQRGGAALRRQDSQQDPAEAAHARRGLSAPSLTATSLSSGILSWGPDSGQPCGKKERRWVLLKWRQAAWTATSGRAW